MSQQNHLTIPGRFDKVKEACDFVCAGAEEVGFTKDEVFRIQLACDEACTNIIEHAYGAEDVGEIEVSWQRKEGAFIIELRDNGRPFKPEEIPPPSVPHAPGEIDDIKVGGLGLHFMRTLMDDVIFSFDDQGNELVMVKHLRSSTSGRS
jgi:serine/threonine-protein kinase RsbW